MLVVALLAATAAAFALTQGLKLEKSPIFGTDVQPVFSPVCKPGCERETALIEFKLRKADRLDVSIVEGGEVVRTIERGAEHAKGSSRSGGTVATTRAGCCPRASTSRGPPASRAPDDHAPEPDQDRRDAAGRPGRQGRAASSRRTATAGRPGDGPLPLSEEGRGPSSSTASGRARTLFPRTEETIVWNGKVGAAGAAGRYLLQLAAFDRPGTIGPTAPMPVAVRYVALGRYRIPVAAGARFAVRVSSDARRVRWTLGGRSGFAPPGTLRLRAPLQKGQFTLTVSANGHTARAAVFVREPAR